VVESVKLSHEPQAVTCWHLVTLVAGVPHLAPALLQRPVGYSRIYVGVHYPADVLAGAVLGTVAGLAAAIGSRALGKRWLE